MILGSGVRRNEGYSACSDVQEMLLFYCDNLYFLKKSQIEGKKTWQVLIRREGRFNPNG